MRLVVVVVVVVVEVVVVEKEDSTESAFHKQNCWHVGTDAGVPRLAYNYFHTTAVLC